jgi:hypothetical protein
MMATDDEMRRILTEAQRLMQKGGGGGYLTYALRDFFTESPPQFLVMPDIQQRRQYPFTMDCARRFFGYFEKQPFNFAGMITSIVIYDGKENLPDHSYAAGWLFQESLEEIGQLGSLPNPIGSIHFEFGGTTKTPTIRVEVAAQTPNTRWVGDTPYTQCRRCQQWSPDERIRGSICPGCGKSM